MRAQVTVKNRRRIALGFAIIALLLIALVFRVAWIQIVDAEELSQKAIDQQTKDTPIEAERNLRRARPVIRCGRDHRRSNSKKARQDPTAKSRLLQEKSQESSIRTPMKSMKT